MSIINLSPLFELSSELFSSFGGKKYETETSLIFIIFSSYTVVTVSSALVCVL